MAEEEKQKNSEVEEEMKKIPVFTVLKNGRIVKNIFLLENPPPPPPAASLEEDRSIKTSSPSSIDSDEEVNLIVGRHPDCDIVLEHPSISRFHLRILLKPSSQKLSLIDLSSVHGTWVLDRKIEPEVRFDLNEGDTMKLGSSTRVYRLHWVPLNRVFDEDNPLIFHDLKSSLPFEEKEPEGEEDFENEEPISSSIQMPETSLDLENLLPFDEEKDEINENESLISFLRGQDCFPSAPPMPQNMNSPFSDVEEESEALGFNEKENQNPFLIGENQSPLRGLEQWSDYVVSESVYLNLPVQLGTPAREQIDNENQNTGAVVAIDKLSELENVESPQRKLELKKSTAKSSRSRRAKTPADQQFDKENQNLEALIGKDLLYELDKQVSPLRKSEPKKSSGMSILSRRGTSANRQFNKENQNPQSHVTKDLLHELENLEPRKSEQKSGAKSIWSRRENSPAYQHFNKENQKPKSLVIKDLLHELENQNPQSHVTKDLLHELENLEPRKSEQKPGAKSIWSRRENSPAYQHFNKENQKPKSLVIKDLLHELENLESPPRKSEQKSDTKSIWSRREKSPAYGHFDKENQNPQALDTTMHVLSEFEDQDSPPRKSEQKSDTPSIWSRRGKSASSIQIQTGRSRTKGIEEASANVMEGAVVPKTLFMGPEHEEEEEMFTPDKENFTPKHVSGSKSTKKGRLEEIKNRSYSGSLSSKVVLNQNLDREEGLFDSANKENTTPLVLRESNSKKSASENRARLEPEMIMMKRIAGRVPFQSLLPNSPSMSNSDIWIPNSNATRSDTSVGCSPTVDRNYVSSPLSFQDHYIGEAMNRKWNMVVDTSCLLNKDSWKFLKLLEGLKGTHLIIPRMVIRELDCLKRRGSLFRRTAEVSSVLEWIEECMMKTNWWIHVQNSLEESLPIAPTPPASPRILPNQGSGGPAFARSIPYCTWSLMEIASPTAEDHILDCALLFKKIKNGEQLVLLSNDVSLKIKAMAEGLICETAEEFRESLVNPFSGRFLWSESTPRGPTWSSLNDAASLRKNYYQFAVKKKTSKSYGEGAKGLKLILRHNSHYGQMSPVN